jgi:hypothetical protein
VATRATAFALFVLALAPSWRAFAEDDPSCAQYQEPMAYNACLARHGPKANAAAVAHSGGIQPQRAARGRAYEGEPHAQTTGFGRWPHAERVRGRVHMEFNVR